MGVGLDPRAQEWTIDNGQTVSDSVQPGPCELVGAEFPSALTGVSVTFQVSQDDTTFVGLDWEGVEVSFTVAVDRGLSWDPAKFAGWRYVKIVSSAAEGAERTIVPVWRDYR
jgi:hypothetical protein